MKSGFTQRTVQSIQLNAGVLLSSYEKGGAISQSNIIGATRGGGSVNIKPDLHQVAIDGVPTYTKGTERCDGYVCQLNFTMVEFTALSIRKALVGASISETADTRITAVTKVLAEDYSDIYWVGDTSDGKNIVIKLKNAMNIDGLGITASDKGEGTFGLNLTAHYDVEDLETAPFEIIFEDVTSATTYSVTYNAGEGTGNVPVDNNAYLYNDTVNIKFAPIPTKTGSTFLGWDTSAEATTPTYTASGTITLTIQDNVTLYAIFD